MAKKPAYTYHYVATEPSSSGRDPYKVQIRVDNRIADPVERVRLAELTCNCPGWTFKRGDTRTCDHVQRHRTALERFKETERQSLRDRVSIEAQPWLPEIRDNYGIPDLATVMVRDRGGKLSLQWLDEYSHPQRVGINRSTGRAASQILSVLDRPESRFIHFDFDAWLTDHEVKPVRLPWAPGLDFTPVEAAESPVERDRWENVFGSAFFAREIPAVSFGRLPATLHARRTRFAKLFADYKPTDVVQVSWKENVFDFEDTLTVAAFAARIGLNEGDGALQRALRLCGVRLAETHSHGWLQAPEGGSPYNLRQYLINDMPIGGVTLDTRRHIVFFWTNTSHLAQARKLYFDDRAFDFVSNAQNLVHIYLSEDEGIELQLDELNECLADSNEVPQMFQVAAEFIRRARLTDLAQACGFDPDHNRWGVVPLDGTYQYAPKHEAKALWRLTDPGQELLCHILDIEQLLNQPHLPASTFLADVTKLIQVVLELVPGCPPAPELAMRHAAQQAARDWLGRLQGCLRDSRLAAFLGEDSPAIVPDWYAADLEPEAV